MVYLVKNYKGDSIKISNHLQTVLCIKLCNDVFGNPMRMMFPEAYEYVYGVYNSYLKRIHHPGNENIGMDIDGLIWILERLHDGETLIFKEI